MTAMKKMSQPRARTPLPAAGVGPPLEVLLHVLAAGGDTVARHDGLVIFAPYTLPGERAL